MREASYVCGECGRKIDRREISEHDVPAVDDDQAWERIAGHHARDCVWVVTRAHRQDELPPYLMLRAYRVLEGLTRAECALQLGLRRQDMAHLERGPLGEGTRQGRLVERWILRLVKWLKVPSNVELRRLRVKALEEMDAHLVDMCTLALEDDEEAKAICARAIADARAMPSPPSDEGA